jgi:hypothetical protein
MVRALKVPVGLAPSLPHRHSLVDQRYVDLEARKGRPRPMARELCAGFPARNRPGRPARAAPKSGHGSTRT